MMRASQFAGRKRRISNVIVFEPTGHKAMGIALSTLDFDEAQIRR